MDHFFNPPLIWFIIGFLFFLLEFALPGFILFFFGLGAWTVAVILMFTDISVNVQILIFIGVSLLTVVALRKWLQKKFGMTSPGDRDLPDEIIGKRATAETAIMPGTQGKVLFRGTSWSAASTDNIVAGQEVIITGYESILLHVKSS